ncbi:MAG: hypothetical protein ACK5H2_02995 [Beutenbergiaceae bacterium]
MIRKIFAVVLILLGLGTVAAAIASGTIWRPDDQVTLTLPADPDVPLLVTEPGVLNAVSNTVEVRVIGETADTPLLLAMAQESDVLAWVGDAPHWSISGLADWETLSYVAVDGAAATDDQAATDDPTATDDPEATQEPAATDEATATDDPEATQEPAATDEATATDTASPTGTEDDGEGADVVVVPNPAGSDLWVEQVDGVGELEYSWTAVPGRWVMLLATDGTSAAPQVELTWEREVTTPFVQPGIILGSIVTVLGVGLLVLFLLSDREKRRNQRAAALAAEAPVTTGPIASLKDGERPLTRRELREASTGAIPVAAPEPESAPDDTEADVSPAAEPEAEPESEPDSGTSAVENDSAGRANELDAWVRSGAASPAAHSSASVPADLELEPLGPALERTDTEAARPRASAAPGRTGLRRSRRERRERSRPPVAPKPPAEPSSSSQAAPTESLPAVSAPESAPPAGPTAPGISSGPAWRQAWGLGPATTDDGTEAQDEGGQR